MPSSAAAHKPNPAAYSNDAKVKKQKRPNLAMKKTKRKKG